MSVGSLIAVGIIEGPSSSVTTTTLTAQDLVNIKAVTRSAVWDAVIDSTYTAKQCMRIQDSALAGLASGFVNGDSNGILKSLDGLKDRITVVSDRFGNRTSIVIDIT